MGKQSRWQIEGAGWVPSEAVPGWPGVLLPPVSLFGCRFRPVVELDLDVHLERWSSGFAPQLDEDVLTIWEWPESDAPGPALTLSGALFDVGRSWRRTLGEAQRWQGFGPVALLDRARDASTDESCRWECAFAGVGLVSGCNRPWETVIPVGGRAEGRARCSADRWVEEFLYVSALSAGAFPEG